MTCKQSLALFFYGSHESKIFSSGISKSNVFKSIKLIQFFSAEFCLPVKLTLKVLTYTPCSYEAWWFLRSALNTIYFSKPNKLRKKNEQASTKFAEQYIKHQFSELFRNTHNCTKNTLKAYWFLIQEYLLGINPGWIKKSKLVKPEPSL